ncbi:MAG TPA: hypothetical protein VF678_05425, partial [bacterium]
MSIVRKSALIFIAVMLVLALAVIYLLRSSFVERTVEVALERMFEAPVDLSGLALNPFTLQAGFRRLRIADADHPDRWLVEAGPAAFDVNMTQLLGKKLVVREMSLQNVAMGTDRPEGKGVAPRPRPKPAKDASDKDQEPGALSGLVPELNLSSITQNVNVDQLMQGRKLTALDKVASTRAMAAERIKYWQDRMSNT